jgi:hypothetical protein
LYRRLGVLQGRGGRVRKISPPLGFDPRNVRLAESRYTDYATPAHYYYYYYYYNTIIIIINAENIHDSDGKKTENDRTVVLHGNTAYGQKNLYVIHIFYAV